MKNEKKESQIKIIGFIMVQVFSITILVTGGLIGIGYLVSLLQ